MRSIKEEDTVSKEADAKLSDTNFPILTGDDRTSAIVGDVVLYNITIVSRGGSGASRGVFAVIRHTC